jgi:hypothetical protein
MSRAQVVAQMPQGSQIRRLYGESPRGRLHGPLSPGYYSERFKGGVGHASYDSGWDGGFIGAYHYR